MENTHSSDQTKNLTEKRIISAQEILQAQCNALLRLQNGLNDTFSDAVSIILSCKGAVMTTGAGKAGIIAQKFSATLASLGTPSHYIHPTDALHGDLGRISPQDIMVMFSLSGETEEICRLLPPLKEQIHTLIAITGNKNSTLAQNANVVLDIHFTREAGKLGLAPTSSTLAMLALSDTLALIVSEERDFTDVHFAQFHPAGMLGRKLSHVEDYMRPLSLCRLASETESVRNVFLSLRRPGRRTGAIMLTTSDGTLSGFFTDSDLSRLFERGAEKDFDAPISTVMTRSPISVAVGTPMEKAVELMIHKKISELPVIDLQKNPVGMLDITDVIALFPHITRE
ncbi:MAG: KpsF/GutQ family sugar-phosphate isomerase [Planctomycetia bacterium]|nr:KpsF/GutQ family sugar-phosphate isomerase [Planctomycetia bacterium]